MQRKRPPLPPKENMKRINTIGQSGGRSWEQEPWSLHWKLASYFQTGVNHWCNHCSNPTGPINMIPRCYSVRSRRPTEDPLPFRSCLNGDLAHTGSLLCCPVFFHFILLCFLLCYLIFFKPVLAVLHQLCFLYIAYQVCKIKHCLVCRFCFGFWLSRCFRKSRSKDVHRPHWLNPVDWCSSLVIGMNAVLTPRLETWFMVSSEFIKLPAGFVNEMGMNWNSSIGRY